jgi:hypothetical protein
LLKLQNWQNHFNLIFRTCISNQLVRVFFCAFSITILTFGRQNHFIAGMDGEEIVEEMLHH